MYIYVFIFISYIYIYSTARPGCAAATQSSTARPGCAALPESPPPAYTSRAPAALNSSMAEGGRPPALLDSWPENSPVGLRVNASPIGPKPCRPSQNNSA